MMSSAAMPDENIPGIVKAIPGLGPKPFAFPPESLFAFSPESRSSSPRNHRSRSPRNPFRLRPEYALDAVSAGSLVVLSIREGL
jgi:hypothetical protein